MCVQPAKATQLKPDYLKFACGLLEQCIHVVRMSNTRARKSCWFNIGSLVSYRDAQDAARGRDGYDFFGNRLRVEMSRGARERGPPPAPPTFRGRGTGFRVLIKGLPISASWQDLKVRVSQVRSCNGQHPLVVLACKLDALELHQDWQSQRLVTYDLQI